MAVSTLLYLICLVQLFIPDVIPTNCTRGVASCVL